MKSVSGSESLGKPLSHFFGFIPLWYSINPKIDEKGAKGLD